MNIVNQALNLSKGTWPRRAFAAVLPAPAVGPLSRISMAAAAGLALFIVLMVLAAPARATLTIEPITWNVVGLDSNNVNVGPNHFPVGARVTSDTAVTGVTVTFDFTTGSSNPADKYAGDAWINLRGGTLGVITLDLTPGVPKDAYFEVAVTRIASAYDKTRSYWITADDGSTPAVSTPVRDLYVEKLISQARNSVTNMYLSATKPNPSSPPLPGEFGTSIANGGAMTLMVGETYFITLEAKTATNGYGQLESFINFPNIIFQVLSVDSTYSADSSATVNPPYDKLYADGCIWDNNPSSPNYRSCLSTGKLGGNITNTYEVKILEIPGSPLVNPAPLSTLVYDFSGSSYHYNADYGVSTRFANIVNASIEKSFVPKTINPNTTPAGTATLTFTITNPGPSPITGVNFIDNLPASVPGGGQMTIANTTVDYLGFTVPPSETVSVDQTALSFTGAEIPGYGTATIAVTVTTTAGVTGTYINNSGNLFINSTIDTLDNATDSLVATTNPPAPSTCGTYTTLATWTMSNGIGTAPVGPNYATKAANVSTATTAAGLTGTTGSSQALDRGMWAIRDAWLPAGGVPTGSAEPYFEFEVDTSNYGGVQINFQTELDPNGEWAAANDLYVFKSADGGSFTQVYVVTGISKNLRAWGPIGGAADTGSSTTTFRICLVGRKTPQETTSRALLDNVTISGCPRPSQQPTLSKSFDAASIPLNGVSALTFTFTNPNVISIDGVTFEDILPAGLTIATPNGLTAITCTTGSCTNSQITAGAGTQTIELSGAPATSGATLSDGANCSFSVDVLGVTAGSYRNITSPIESTAGINTTAAGYGVADIDVIAPPVINKTFGQTNLLTNGTTSLTFTITNPNSHSSLTGVAFTDNLPAGLDVDTTGSPFTLCGGGTLTLTDNGSDPNQDSIVLSGASLSAGASCTFSVNVTGNTNGEKVNTTLAVTSTNGGTGNTASARLLVRAPILALSFIKQISTSTAGPWYSYLPVAIGTTLYYRFMVENTGDLSLTNVAVSDPSLNPFTCTWQYLDSNPSPPPAEILVDYSPQSPLTIPAPSTSNDQHIAYCVPGNTVTALAATVTNTATVSSTGLAAVSDSATYNGVDPTAVIMGRVDLVVMAVSDFLNGIGAPDLDAFDLSNLLRAWDPAAAGRLAGANQEALHAALAGYLDPDGDGRVMVLRWETIEERGTIGFYGERRCGGAWTRINAQMLPGLIAAPMGAQYWLADPGARPDDACQYRLIEVEARGTTREYGPFDPRVENMLQ